MRWDGRDPRCPAGRALTAYSHNGLDALGNWDEFDEDDDGDASWDLEQKRYHNDVNEIDTDNTHGDADDAITLQPSGAGSDWADPVHDAAGNMTEGPQSGTPTATQKYVYDAWSRLVEVTDGSDTTVEEYEYDGLGRRIVKETAYSGGSPQDTYDYYYNRSYQVVEERLDADTDPVAQYVWHPYYVDALAVRYYDADTDNDFNENNDGDHYYTHDANFNVTAVLEDDGTVLERYHYTPYGEVKMYNGSWASEHTTSTIANPHLYTGRRLDEETGLYYYRARYYDAPLGRLVNRDPIGYEANDANLYRYVRNNPVIATDPSGTWPSYLRFTGWCKCARGASVYTIGFAGKLGPKCTYACLDGVLRNTCTLCCNSVATCWGRSVILLSACVSPIFWEQAFEDCDCLSVNL